MCMRLKVKTVSLYKFKVIVSKYGNAIGADPCSRAIYFLVDIMIFFFAHVVTECQTKAEFVILLMAGLKWLSKVWRAGLSADDEQRNRCSTSIFGELNESLKRVMASCAPIEASLSVALVSSSHLLAQVRSNAVPGNRGAPISSAFSKGICRKDSNVGSVT